MWTVSALALSVFAMLAIGPGSGHTEPTTGGFKLNARTIPPQQPGYRGALQSWNSQACLTQGLSRRLMGLSLARYVIQVLMAGQTAEAIGVHIPLWHLAAAMPFVVIACVIVVTPGWTQ